jgi:hypothetical protein
MSTDKPTIATLKFFPNKHIEVEIDGLKNVHPRALAIGANLLEKAYLQKRAQHNAEEHKAARKAKVDAAEKAEKESEEYHKKRDKELAEAAAADVPQVQAGAAEDIPDEPEQPEPATDAEPDSTDEPK